MNFEKYMAGMRLQQQLADGKEQMELNDRRNRILMLRLGQKPMSVNVETSISGLSTSGAHSHGPSKTRKQRQTTKTTVRVPSQQEAAVAIVRQQTKDLNTAEKITTRNQQQVMQSSTVNVYVHDSSDVVLALSQQASQPKNIQKEDVAHESSQEAPQLFGEKDELGGQNDDVQTATNGLENQMTEEIRNSKRASQFANEDHILRESLISSKNNTQGIAEIAIDAQEKSKTEININVQDGAMVSPTNQDLEMIIDGEELEKRQNSRSNDGGETNIEQQAQSFQVVSKSYEYQQRRRLQTSKNASGGGSGPNTGTNQGAKKNNQERYQKDSPREATRGEDQINLSIANVGQQEILGQESEISAQKKPSKGNKKTDVAKMNRTTEGGFMARPVLRSKNSLLYDSHDMTIPMPNDQSSPAKEGGEQTKNTKSIASTEKQHQDVTSLPKSTHIDQLSTTTLNNDQNNNNQSPLKSTLVVYKQQQLGAGATGAHRDHQQPKIIMQQVRQLHDGKESTTTVNMGDQSSQNDDSREKIQQVQQAVGTISLQPKSIKDKKKKAKRSQDRKQAAVKSQLQSKGEEQSQQQLQTVYSTNIEQLDTKPGNNQDAYAGGVQAIKINQQLVINRHSMMGTGRSRQEDHLLDSSQFKLDAERNVYSSETSMVVVPTTSFLNMPAAPRTTEVSHRRPIPSVRGSTLTANSTHQMVEKSYRPEIREAITAFVTGRHRSMDMTHQLSGKRTATTSMSGKPHARTNSMGISEGKKRQYMMTQNGTRQPQKHHQQTLGRRRMTVEEQHAQRLQEKCSLYALAYQKDFNRSLNGSNVKRRSLTGSLVLAEDSREEMAAAYQDNLSQLRSQHQQHIFQHHSTDLLRQSLKQQTLTKPQEPSKFLHFSQFQMPEPITRSSQQLTIQQQHQNQQQFKQQWQPQQYDEPSSFAPMSRFSDKRQQQLHNKSTILNLVPKEMQPQTKNIPNKRQSVTTQLMDEPLAVVQMSVDSQPSSKKNQKNKNDENLRFLQQQQTLGSRDHDFRLVFDRIERDQQVRHISIQRQHMQRASTSQQSYDLRSESPGTSSHFRSASQSYHQQMRRQSTLRRNSIKEEGSYPANQQKIPRRRRIMNQNQQQVSNAVHVDPQTAAALMLTSNYNSTSDKPEHISTASEALSLALGPLSSINQSGEMHVSGRKSSLQHQRKPPLSQYKTVIQTMYTGPDEVEAEYISVYQDGQENSISEEILPTFAAAAAEHTYKLTRNTIAEEQETANLEPSIHNTSKNDTQPQMPTFSSSPLNLQINIKENLSRKHSTQNSGEKIIEHQYDDMPQPQQKERKRIANNPTGRSMSQMKQRSMLSQLLHRSHVLQQHRQAKYPRPDQTSSNGEAPALNLMPNYIKLPIRGRKEIMRNPEVQRVMVAHGKRPMELYDDYKISQAKESLAKGQAFDINISEDRAAAISITQYQPVTKLNSLNHSSIGDMAEEELKVSLGDSSTANKRSTERQSQQTATAEHSPQRRQVRKIEIGSKNIASGSNRFDNSQVSSMYSSAAFIRDQKLFQGIQKDYQQHQQMQDVSSFQQAVGTQSEASPGELPSQTQKQNSQATVNPKPANKMVKIHLQGNLGYQNSQQHQQHQQQLKFQTGESQSLNNDLSYVQSPPPGSKDIKVEKEQ